jgi:transketolase
MAHARDIAVAPASLAQRAPLLRQRILRMIHAADAGHPGGSLSVIDLLQTLMVGWGRFRPHQPDLDWLVLAKGHVTPAYYTALVELGYLQEEELLTYRQFGTRLQGHPDRRKLPAVQVTTGHLGQGLSIGVGIALGEKLKSSDRNVYVVLGDGDLHEGQTWEAAMAASHYQIDNLVALADLNRLTQHGPVEEVMDVAPLADKWTSFGWAVRSLDGHDYSAILEGLAWTSGVRCPAILLCHTVKGKGVSFMEGDPLWHSCHLSTADLERALEEVGG